MKLRIVFSLCHRSLTEKAAIRISLTNRRSLTNASSTWYKSTRRRKKSTLLLFFDTDSNRRRVWKNHLISRHQAVIKAIRTRKVRETQKNDKKIILSILQYNVKNSKNEIMISLLMNSQIREYDILTIQKSWRNVCVSTSYNSFSIDFHFLYEMKENIRMCFYVNTKLNVNNWSIDFVFSNLCTLKFNLNDQRIINIYNVYNLSSMFYASGAFLLIIEMTQHRLVIDEKHVLLKNFNLHHLLWSDSIRSTQHTAIDQLIDLLVNKHMNLCLFQKIVTWKVKNSRNIIDLIFMIERLQTSITHCENKRDLNQSLNYISIFTIFTLKIEQTFISKKRAWKKIDNERLTFCLRAFVVSASFNNVNDIETFVKEIQFSVQLIIQEAILMIKELERAQFFWSFKCSEIVTTIKRKRRKWSSLRIEKNWKTYLKFIDVKKKIIVKKKKLKF